MGTTTDVGRVRERSTGVYTATLVDENGDPVPLVSLSTLTLSLYDVASGTVINSRDHQNVLNANDVTFHSTSGLLTWNVRSADNAIVGTTGRRFERHRAVFEYTWDSGDKRDWHRLEYLVEAEAEVS